MECGCRPFVPLARFAGPAGGKAAGLRRLLTAGLPVPDTWVITHDLLERTSDGCLLAGARFLADTALRGAPAVVRSSAENEDVPLATGAGVYRSHLDRRTPEEIVAAVRWVRAARADADARAYRRMRRTGGSRVHVLVQRMIGCRTWGVLYTRDPVSDEPGMLVESSRGVSVPVVAGLGCEESYALPPAAAGGAGPSSWELDGRPLPELLWRLGGVLEREFGGPLDVEWGEDGQRLWVFQARPLTPASPVPAARNRPRPPATALRVTPVSRGYALGVPVPASPGPRPGAIVRLPVLPTAGELEGLRRAAGLLVQAGNVLSHAGALCREAGLPVALAPGGSPGDWAGPVLLDAVAGVVAPLSALPSHEREAAVAAVQFRAGLRPEPDGGPPYPPSLRAGRRRQSVAHRRPPATTPRRAAGRTELWLAERHMSAFAGNRALLLSVAGGSRVRFVGRAGGTGVEVGVPSRRAGGALLDRLGFRPVRRTGTPAARHGGTGR
ncbi:PEP/pyruvate-binding domain-containing protein [Streptomyces sp. NPDC046870]|uniref:PEP/pyruvate-binding domain-containing protein n=1 Tax=Streptomyces sp. NPDC046870 TaxID=3155135 RepID=UPI003452FFC6